MKRIFISYSHKDEEWKDRMVTHLKVPQGFCDLDVWDDRRIKTGDDWYNEINKAINKADAAILLISADFLTSKFIKEKEIPRLLQSKAKKNLKIFPLIVRDSRWPEISWLNKLQVSPKDGKPLASFEEHLIDSVLSNFAKEIKQILDTESKREITNPIEKDRDPQGIGLAKIPTILSRGNPSEYEFERLTTLGNNGVLGRLFPQMEDLDILEAFFIDREKMGSFTVCLNLQKTGKTYMYKIGWMTRFEIENYQNYIGKGKKSISAIKFPPFTQVKGELDIVELEVTLSNPDQLITLSEFLKTLSCEKCSESLETIFRNWIDRILNGLEGMLKTGPKIEEHSINYSHIYAPYLADYVLHVEEVDLTGNHPNIMCKEEIYPIPSPNRITLKRHGPYFLTWVTILRKSEEGRRSPFRASITLVPGSEEIANQLINIINIKEVKLVYTTENEAKHREERINIVFGETFRRKENIKFNKILEKRNQKLGRHFGYISMKKTTLGVAHGSLEIGSIIIDQGNKSPYYDSYDLWSIDYQYIGNRYPIIKDHASLEASIWIDVIFNRFDNLSVISDIFIRIFCVTRVFQFDAEVSKENYKQALAGMIMQIRQKAWHLYKNNLLAEQWWQQYNELLYHELLTYVERNSSKEGENKKSWHSNLVKLYLILSFLGDLIDEWHPVKDKESSLAYQEIKNIWKDLKRTCNDFGHFEEVGFFQLVKFGLQAAISAVADEKSDIPKEIIRTIGENIVLETLSFFEDSGLSPDQLYTMGTFHEEFKETQEEKLERLRCDVVANLNDLKAIFLEGSKDFHYENHLKKSLALFKIQMAIEKSGQIEISLEGQEAGERPQKLSQLFERHKDFVLKGEAGTGKSWSLALFYSKLYDKLNRNESPCWVPIFVAVNEIYSDVKEVMDNLKNMTAKKEKNGNTKSLNDQSCMLLKPILQKHNAWLARSGCFLFIIDGLNEIGVEERKTFASYFTKLRELFPYNRFAVASRKLHWDKSLYPGLKPVIEVQELTDEEIRKFIEYFFENLKRPHGGVALNNLLNGPGMEESMKKLRRNPFFLDKILRIYEKLKKIPANRGDLFRSYIAECSNDLYWFDLQNWMLGHVGVYMSYIGKTNIPENIAESLLFLGFATAPMRLFQSYKYIIPVDYEINVKIDDEIKPGDTLAQDIINPEYEISAKTDGRVIDIKDRTITIKLENLLETRDDNFLSINWLHYRPAVDDGETVKVGATLAHNVENPADVIKTNVDAHIVLNDKGIMLEPLIYLPEKSESFLKRLEGKDIRNNDDITKELISRFDIGHPDQIWPVFYKLLERIQKNGHLERGRTDKNSEFSHHSIQEYFAALQFSHIYECNPECLEKFIRYRKFDEMMHIVIGCVFEDKLHIVRNILNILLEQTQIIEVRDCLARAEHIDEPCKRDLLNRVNQFVNDPLVPDEARGAAIECLPHLIEKEEILTLLSRADLQEGTAMWRALLSVTFQCCSKDNGEEIDKEIRFQKLLKFGLKKRNRKKDLLIVTANWMGENNPHLRWLAEELKLNSVSTDPDLKVIKALWQALKKSTSFVLDFEELASVLDNIEDTDLYNDIFIYEYDDRGLFCQDYYTEDKIIETIKRLGAAKENWHVPIASLLKLTFELDIPKQKVTGSIVEVCTEHEEFPAELLDTMWQLDADVVLNLELDIKTLEWCLQQESQNRPSGIGKRIIQCIKDAKTLVLCEFKRNIETLVRLAVTHDNELADGLIDVINRIVSACNEMNDTAYWRANILAQLLKSDVDPVLKSFKRWGELDGKERLAWLIIARKKKDGFDELAFVPFWEKDLVDHLRYLIFIGGGTDHFIRSRPKLILKTFSDYISFDRKLDKAIETNFDYINQFTSENASYSTRIIVYKAMHISELWRRHASHPHHPPPTKGSEDFESLERLLRANFTVEAAYLLCDCESSWDQIKKDLPEELHIAFKKATEEVKGFEPVKRDVGILENARLRTKAGLDEIIRISDLLQDKQIPLLLKDLYYDRRDGLSAKRIKALSASRVWRNSDDIPMQNSAIVEIGLYSGLLLLDEDEQKLMKQFLDLIDEEEQQLEDRLFQYRLRIRERGLHSLRKLSRIYDEWKEIELLLSILQNLNDFDMKTFDDSVKAVETIHSRGCVWNFRDPDRILSHFLRGENFYNQDDIFRYSRRHRIPPDFFFLEDFDREDDMYYYSHRHRHHRPLSFPHFLFRHFSSLPISIDETCQILAQLLDEISERIGDDCFGNLMKKLLELSWYAHEIDYRRLNEIVEELKTGDNSRISIEFLKRTPRLQSLEKKNLLFLGNYAHILIIVTKAIRVTSSHEQLTNFYSLSGLLRRSNDFIIEPGKDITWHNFTQSIMNGINCIKDNDDIKYTDHFVFLYLFLGLGIRIIDREMFTNVLASDSNVLKAKSHKIRAKISEISKEYNVEPKDIGDIAKIYSKLEHFLEDEKTKAKDKTSLRDIRSGFFWYLNYMDVNWMIMDNLEDIAKMFGNLPGPLLKELDKDILHDLAFTTDSSKSNLWRLLQLCVLSKSSHERELKVDVYGTIVEHILGLVKESMPEIAPRIFADAVCAVTNKEKGKKEFTDKLEFVLIQALDKKRTREEGSATTVWGNNKDLNETIWRIVQGIKKKTDIKMNIPADFDEDLLQSEEN